MYFQDIMKIVVGSVVAFIVAIIYFIYFDSKDIFKNSSFPIKIIIILIPMLLIVNTILSFIFKDPKRRGEEEELKSKNISTLHIFASFTSVLLVFGKIGMILFR